MVSLLSSKKSDMPVPATAVGLGMFSERKPKRASSLQTKLSSIFGGAGEIGWTWDHTQWKFFKSWKELTNGKPAEAYSLAFVGNRSNNLPLNYMQFSLGRARL